MFIQRCLVVSLFLVAFMGNAQAQVFKTPSMSFIENPNETIQELSFSNTSIDKVQTAINEARAKHPTDILRITLSGNFTITNNPFTVSSKTILLLNNTSLKATNATTAKALIAIEKSEFISIGCMNGTALLDGGNKSIEAISIQNSGKIHINNLQCINCKKGGINYLGRGQKVFADAGSITKSSFTNCGDTAISIVDAFHFIFTDNNITTANVGIHLSADRVAISNNSITKCSLGIDASSQYEAITYNNILNCGTAISLSEYSLETLVANNTVKDNKIGFSIKSTKAKIYNNTCDNRIEVTGKGSHNLLYANKGISTTEGNLEGCDYFNPPLVGNMHNDLIKLGKGRSDITIKGGAFSEIRAQLNKAHQAHAIDVIVAHLEGDFITVGNDSLLVQEDECLLLNGRIYGKGNVGKLISFSGNITASISGGHIDGDSTNGMICLMYITGGASVIVDSVKLTNAVREGITKRNSRVSTFIRGCTVDNCHGRGYWQLAADRMYAFNNIATRCNTDGIDLDAYTNNSVVMNNYSCNNRRHGVFIEEGASGHIVLGNTLDSNQTGVAFFNMEVKENHTAQNLVANNYCRWNNRGLQINAKEASKSTKDNVFFNNICTNNLEVGIAGLYNNGNSTNNYIALNTASSNPSTISDRMNGFETNPFWNLLDQSTTLPFELTGFSVKNNAKGMSLLSWATTKETNGKTIEVERSLTMNKYETLAQLPAQGNSNKKQSYSFTDSSRKQTIQFYRLKLVDGNGKSTYSNIVPSEFNADSSAISVQFTNLKSWSAQVNVRTSKPFNNLTIRVFNLSGKEVYHQDYTTEGTPTTDFTRIITVPSILSGVYILYAKTNDADCFKKVAFSRW